MRKLSTASIQLHRQKVTAVQRRLPSLAKIKIWIKVALEHHNFNSNADITVRFVDEPESAKLNFKYRKKHGATNILTFPFSFPDELKLPEKNATSPTRSSPVGANILPLVSCDLDNRTTGALPPPLPILSGDLIICVPLVIKEARLQKLPFTAHLAHLIIHGVLHLLGYTHTQEKYAIIMEKQETTILKKLGYVDPYL